MKKILAAAFTFILLGFAFSSCVSNKEMTYLQGIDTLYAKLKPINSEYDLKIGIDDQLAITVSSADDPKILQPYSNTVLLGGGSGVNAGTTNVQAGVAYYTVDKEGNIRLPSIGLKHVQGMTVEQLADQLKEEFRQKVSDAVVVVKIMSFKVTVLGAVARPGQVQYTNGQRLTLLEAIGQAGDLTNTAIRKGIKVIREKDGQRVCYDVNLTDPKSVFNSPAYFLQQNDVIYVEANKAERVKGSTSYAYLGIASSLLGLVTSVATIIISLTR